MEIGEISFCITRAKWWGVPKTTLDADNKGERFRIRIERIAKQAKKKQVYKDNFTPFSFPACAKQPQPD